MLDTPVTSASHGATSVHVPELFTGQNDDDYVWLTVKNVIVDRRFELDFGFQTLSPVYIVKNRETSEVARFMWLAVDGGSARNGVPRVSTMCLDS